jgi:hypothetical protein
MNILFLHGWHSVPGGVSRPLAFRPLHVLSHIASPHHSESRGQDNAV